MREQLEMMAYAQALRALRTGDCQQRQGHVPPVKSHRSAVSLHLRVFRLHYVHRFLCRFAPRLAERLAE